MTTFNTVLPVFSKKSSEAVKSPISMMKVSLAALLAMGLVGQSEASAEDVDLSSDNWQEISQTVQFLEARQSVPPVSADEAQVATVLKAQKTPNKWLIGGAMALILAALVKLVGTNRVMNIVAEAGPTVRQAAQKISEAPAAAAKAVKSAVMSPVKFILLVGGLAMIGFTGISVFDLQWGVGIATGIAMTGVTWLGSSKMMRAMRRAKVRVRSTNRD